MKTVNISQKEVAALRAYKTDIKTMASHFGISVKEMRDVLVMFEFAKPTKSSVDYVINPIFDFDIKRVTVDNVPETIDDLSNENSPLTSTYVESTDSFASFN